jgi:hypothetical protein
MPVKLTNTTLPAMTTEIQYDQLHKTFREAIEVAQLLGIEYLWIDSLCIVQDSDEERQRESALMDQVYANAVCNLCAASAQDSSGGLLFDCGPAAVQPLVVRMVGMLLEYWEANISQNLEAFHLNRRAWCVQERLLSASNLYFAKDQVYWECCETRTSERFLSGLPDDELPGRGYVKRRFAEFTKNEDPSQQDKQDLDVWGALIELYTKGELTYETDRLVALAGMAHRLQETYQSRYLAGVWEKKYFAPALVASRRI